MASPTSTLIKQRAAKTAAVKPGQWHADFSTVKKYADSKNIPLLAVWSNGDACGHCVAFEKCLLETKFKDWQKTSGVAMWIGFGSDTSKEDKRDGTGYNFAWGAKKNLKLFPFVRLYWKKGKVDVCKTGDDWTGGTGNAKGAEKLVKALKSALKGYTQDCQGCTTTTTTTTTTTPAALPTLGYRANSACGGYELTVDGEPATCLTEETAKRICEAYAKCSV